MDKKYILAIDSGSTGIRAILFNHKGEIVSREYKETPANFMEDGGIEQDPLMMWNTLCHVVKTVLSKNKITANEIAAAGITNQRASFCLWEKKTGTPVINVINWGDVRAVTTADEINKKFTVKVRQKAAKLYGKITGNTMMKAFSMLEFKTDHASVRLKWILDNKPELRSRCKRGELLFGTLDTWFIYNLTGGKIHATDYSNAASTGLYDSFNLTWSPTILSIFNIPREIFPVVLSTNGNFGTVEKNIFGAEFLIHSAVGDQQSALFGHCCINPGDTKISQGSGSFVDCNMGNKPKLSKRGLLPLIAWKLEEEEKPVYMLEGYVVTAGTLINWLGQGIGLSDTPQILNEFAGQCDDTEGVIFIPTPSGIRYPHYNPRTRATIFGLSLSTHRRHLARAVLEGIAMRLIDIIEVIQRDTGVKVQTIKVDGGVSKSNILLQILSDFANIPVERSPESDMTATGAAYLAGLGVGFWKDQQELLKLPIDYNIFSPSSTESYRSQKRKRWNSAIKTVLKFE